MRTLVIVFVLALISIAFEVYSDAAMTSAEIRHGAPDPVTVAIVHGLKQLVGAGQALGRLCS
jgi:uncharacterized YccA/Bax inhibitor family protein